MALSSDCLVIIPTYNEAENAAAIIDAVLALPHRMDVLIVDDGSPDGTAGIVRSKMDEYPGRVHLLERKGKLGLGTAYIAGFKYALAQGYEYIFEMDVAIGSRYVSGVNVVNWPMSRVLMSYFASKYVRFITGMDIHDTTAGFVCYRHRVLQAFDLDKIHFKGYAFQIEMKFTAHKHRFKIVEVPIIFVNRVLGESKMSSGIFSEAVFGVIRLKYHGMTHKYKDYSNENSITHA